MLTINESRLNGARRFVVMRENKIVLMTTSAIEAKACARNGEWRFPEWELRRMNELTPRKVHGEMLPLSSDQGSGGHPLVRG